MFLNDLAIILRWYFWLFLIGLVSLPSVVLLFGKFWDKGYAFGKTLGFLILSYLSLVLGIAKILPFYRSSLFLLLLLWTVFNLFLLKKKKLLPQLFKKNLLKTFILEECFFLGILVFWSWVRGFQPEINGLEKYMDHGFVNAILKSKYFPPHDIWFTPYFINYYYFGHLIAALLTKLTAIESFYTYNLMLATIVANLFVSVFSLTSNLSFHWSKQKNKPLRTSRLIAAGLISAIVVNFAGNLHTVRHIWAGIDKYWYPDATRYIVEKFGAADNTIHEFPMYSHVVADLHGHLSNAPAVIFFLGTLLSLLVVTGKFKLNFKNTTNFLFSLAPFILIAWLLSIFYMTNSWDLAIYALLAGLTIFFLNIQKSGPRTEAIIRTAMPIIVISIFHLVFTLPFNINFQPFFKGVNAVHARSPIDKLLTLWGFFLFIGLSFLLSLVKARPFFNFREKIVKFLSSLLQVKVKLIGLPKDKVAKKRLSPVEVFVLAIILLSAFLIVFPEFLYIKDIYIESHHRANTMFKLTYQTFVMMSILAGFTAYKIFQDETSNWFKGVFRILFLGGFVAVVSYSYFAIRSYYGNLKTYRGLDGLVYLKNLQPGDYEAVLWLEENIEGTPVVVEAVGDSYTTYARISANTGLPTIQGWPVHEWLWRGSYDEPGKRTSEVQTIYESEDIGQTKDLLRQYKAEYLVLGALEQDKYPKLNWAKFDSFGESVFEKEGTRIIKLDLD